MNDRTRQAERRIRDLVASGRLAPGGKLPSERSISDNLGVPPSRVRLILEGLAEEGIVENRKGQGHFSTREHTGQAYDGRERIALFDPVALYERLDEERFARLISWSTLCAEAGVGKGVISRMGQGKQPSPDNLLRLLLWLGSTDIAPYAHFPETL